MTTPCYYCDIKSVGTCKTCIHSDTYEEPMTFKQLTDEEIISTMVQFDVYSNDDQCLIDAGKAILRKAQEK